MRIRSSAGWILRLMDVRRAVLAAVLLGCIALSIYSLTTLPRGLTVPLLLFGGIALVASFLHLRREDIGFEAVAVFPATILFHSEVFAVLPLLSIAIVRLGIGGARGSVSLRDLRIAAREMLAFYFSAWLYVNAVPLSAPSVTTVAGYAFLLIGYMSASLVLRSLERIFEDATQSTDQLLVVQMIIRSQLLLSPIIGLEVLLYPQFGPTGVILGFIPTLLVAHAIGSESRKEEDQQFLLRRNRELSVIRDSSEMLLSAEGEEETARVLMKLVSMLVPVKAAAVVIWETTDGHGYSVFRFGECRPSDQAIVRWISDSRDQLPRALEIAGSEPNCPLSENSVQLLVPVQSVEAVYGLLILEIPASDVPSAETLDLIEMVVKQGAVSVRDHLLKSGMQQKTVEAERYSTTLRAILDVSQGLLSDHDEDTILYKVAHGVRQAMGYDAVLCAIYDPVRKTFSRRAQSGLDDIWQEIRGKEIQEGEITQYFGPRYRISNSYLVPQSRMWEIDSDVFVRRSESGLHLEDINGADLLIVPLMDEETLLGYMSVRHLQESAQLTAYAVAGLEIFASQAVAAIRAARQYAQIRRMTQMDVLTRAYNHRYFQDALLKETRRHQRSGNCFGLAMIDIDNFKSINDSYGHPVGDEILKGLVDEILLEIREVDLVARYGGEEFAIIFPDSRPDSLPSIVERLRERISRRLFPTGPGEVLQVTISSGVSVFPLDGESPAELIASADEALYRAKRGGKNRVSLANAVA